MIHARFGCSIQRRAVEHGVPDSIHVGAPLFVTAGAGSGKTNTLAHRLAHLIVSGADPRRILPMTFSRGVRRTADHAVHEKPGHEPRLPIGV
ncbi:hypothetical protein XI02_09845 [Bradyrhizobium sp. CCBAU 21365]|nr:hypothetical protein XI02_09845 [Bradyrhizobium sp. CCBAU 21365]